MNESVTSISMFTASRPKVKEKRMSFGKLVNFQFQLPCTLQRFVSPTMSKVNGLQSLSSLFLTAGNHALSNFCNLLDSVEENDSLTTCFPLHIKEEEKKKKKESKDSFQFSGPTHPGDSAAWIMVQLVFFWPFYSS